MSAEPAMEDPNALGSSILKQLRQMMEQSESADPREVAAEIVAKIPDSVCRLALQATLYEWVRSRSNLSTTLRNEMGSGIDKGRRGAGHRRHLEAVESYNRKWLKARISVGDNEYRFLRDCTVDDLHYATELRRKQMEFLESWVKRFDAIATILADADVATVGELDDDKLNEIEQLWRDAGEEDEP